MTERMTVEEALVQLGLVNTRHEKHARAILEAVAAGAGGCMWHESTWKHECGKTALRYCNEHLEVLMGVAERRGAEKFRAGLEAYLHMAGEGDGEAK